MSDEYRSVTITGGALVDYNGEGGKPKKRTAKKKQEGGSFANAGTPDPSTWLKSPMQPPIIKVDTGGSLAAAPQPSQPHSSQPHSSHMQPSQPHSSQPHSSQPHLSHMQPSQQPSQQTIQSGGVKQIKVELKKKSVTHKVKLNPKKAEKLKKKQTKKVRKISLGVSSFHKRMTRAKKVEKKVSDMPIDKLKEHLINNKLIKASSKAPESVLRQIAADSQLVAKKVL